MRMTSLCARMKLIGLRQQTVCSVVGKSWPKFEFLDSEACSRYWDNAYINMGAVSLPLCDGNVSGTATLNDRIPGRLGLLGHYQTMTNRPSHLRLFFGHVNEHRLYESETDGLIGSFWLHQTQHSTVA